MNYENQVVSLELSKRLKDLGFKQESLWWWIIRAEGNPIIVGKDKRYTTTFISSSYSAFTVAELGEMLPIGIVMTKYEFNKGGEIRWACAYNDENIGNRICDDTLANCLARMLIWLRGKKII